MSILGINFGNFGSRKLRFDSQKGDISFSGIRELAPLKLVKYGIPSPSDRPQPDEKPADNLPDDAPTLKYGIPSENFEPYVNVNHPVNKKPPVIPAPVAVKYAIPGRF